MRLSLGSCEWVDDEDRQRLNEDDEPAVRGITMAAIVGGRKFIKSRMK